MTATFLPYARAASHFLAVLAILWVGAANLFAGTLVGAPRDVTGATYSGPVSQVSLKPLGTPQTIGTNVYWPLEATATITNNFFSSPLIQGWYWASPVIANPFVATPRVLIYMPDSDTNNIWQFNDCANIAARLRTYVSSNAYVQMTNFPASAITNAPWLTNNATGVTLSGTFNGNGTGLQLPNSATNAITNNATGVTLSGTFSGDGSGLNKTNFTGGIVVSGGDIEALSITGPVGFPKSEEGWGFIYPSGNFFIRDGSTGGGIIVSNNGDLRATTFIGNGAGLTNLPSGMPPNAVNLASNLFNFPKEIYIVAGVYGMAYRMTPTNSGVNSAGQFYNVNPYYGNGSLWSDYASNVLSSDYGLNVIVDSSLSISAYGSEPTELAAGTAPASSPPWDKQTPTLYWLKQRSPNATHTNKLIYLHAPQAGIEAATYTGAQAFLAVTNLATALEKDGWTVALGTFIFNYDYWVAYTNQTATGIQGSNYDSAVRSARWPYVDFFKVTTNWAYRTDLTGDTNYYCGGNHIGYWTGQAIGTNFIRYLITNLLVTAPKTYPPFQNNDSKAGWINWQGASGYLANSYTNERVVWYMATNSGVTGGPQTNGYLAASMTASNLLPNTRYEWQAGFHLQTSAKGGRWDFRTDVPTKQYEFAGRVIYNTASDIVGSGVTGSGTANNTIVGGVRSIGAASDNCGALIAGSFTTGTNVTALQMYYAPEATNAAGTVAKAGFLRVWQSVTPSPFP